MQEGGWYYSEVKMQRDVLGSCASVPRKLQELILRFLELVLWCIILNRWMEREMGHHIAQSLPTESDTGLSAKKLMDEGALPAYTLEQVCPGEPCCLVMKCMWRFASALRGGNRIASYGLTGFPKIPY